MLWAYSQRRINLITFTLDCLTTCEHITDLWLQLIIITIISLKLQRREVSWCNFINYHTSSKCSCKKASPSPNKCLAHFLTKQENTISMPLPSLTLFLTVASMSQGKPIIQCEFFQTLTIPAWRKDAASVSICWYLLTGVTVIIPLWSNITFSHLKRDFTIFKDLLIVLSNNVS